MCSTHLQCSKKWKIVRVFYDFIAKNQIIYIMKKILYFSENFQKTLNLHRIFQNGLFPAFFLISFCAKYRSNSNSILYFVFVIRTRGFDSKLIGSGTYLFDGTYKLRNSIRRRWRFEKEMRNNIFYF